MIGKCSCNSKTDSTAVFSTIHSIKNLINCRTANSKFSNLLTPWFSPAFHIFPTILFF